MNTTTPQLPPKKKPPFFLFVLLGFALFVAALLTAIATRPDSYTVVRKTTIAAPPEVVFPHVNDFHKWKAWSPWEKLDPNMTTTFAGPEAGVDSSYAWAGNDQVGEGKMTILDSKPNEAVKIKLEFVKPFADVCDTDFAFKAVPDGTEVTWTMSGKNSFLGKAIGLVMDMEKMIGGSFEEGLVELKKVSEEKK